MNVRLFDPLTDPAWDRAVAMHPDAGIFHSSRWAAVLRRTYGHDLAHLCVEEDGEPVCLIPLAAVRSWLTGRRAVSMPFADRCDPLRFGHADPWEVLDVIKRVARREAWRFVEVRGLATGTVPDATPSYWGHQVDLGCGTDALFRDLPDSNRRSIRKAENSELSIDCRTDAGAMADFYRLHLRTRRRHGVPPQPFRFFRSVQEEILGRGFGFVATASHPRHGVVAGAVFFQWRKQGMYKFGASDERFQNLRANNLVMWRGIQNLASRGAGSLDFGRSDLHAEGLLRFKRSWGADQFPIHYHRVRPNRQPINRPKPRVTVSPEPVFRLLPDSINRAAGLVLYPHLD